MVMPSWSGLVVFWVACGLCYLTGRIHGRRRGGL